MLSEALTAVEGWDVVRTVRTSPVLYPLLSASHILSFAMLVGGIAAFDLRVLRSGANGAGEVPVTVSIGLAGAVATGLVLLACRATTYAASPALWTKFAVLALALANVALFRMACRRSDLLAKASASVSLACWTGVVFAGRWIGFV